MYHGGKLLWLSQTGQTYALFCSGNSRHEGTYTAYDTPVFDLPTAEPPGDTRSLIVGTWALSDPLAAQPYTTFDLTFGADGAFLVNDCRGTYHLVDNSSVHIETGNCDETAVPTGAYDYTFAASGDSLVLSQSYHDQSPDMLGGLKWVQPDNGYMVYDATWAEILPYGQDSRWDDTECTVQIACPSQCTITLSAIECASGRSPVAEGEYQYVYPASQSLTLVLARHYRRVQR